MKYFCQESDKKTSYMYENLEKKEENSAKKEKLNILIVLEKLQINVHEKVRV
jgi:hypothetical protein